MDPEAALERLGGTARRADLLSLVSRRSLRRALVERRVVRAGRDRYSLPAADQARRAAVLLNGYLTHLSAAVHHGWEVRAVPERPHVAIPRGRAARPTQVKRAFERDVERYTALVVSGWRVLRFTWAEVMLDPGHVRTCLRELYAELAAA